MTESPGHDPDCSRKRRRAEPEAARSGDDDAPAASSAASSPSSSAAAQDASSQEWALPPPPPPLPPPTTQSAEAGLPHSRLAHLPAVRTLLDGVLPRELCRELVFILRSCSTAGYRPHVRSATIHDVVATAPPLLPPLVRARNAVLCAVEAAFGLSLELVVEFTGLIAWAGGAALGWHHDANREYLAQRHMSAVVYLNNQGEDFGGGDFRFQDGPGPLCVAPRAGRLVAYTADRRNVHCVEEVAWGERCTLTCWFSLDPAAAEDRRVLSQLGSYLTPKPAGQGACTSSGRRSTSAAAATSPPPAEPLAPAAPGFHPSDDRGARSLFGDLAEPRPTRRAEATRGWVGLSGDWWRCWLGPGLPATMYELPLSADAGGATGGGAVQQRAAAEGGGGDLRLLRLRQLGLYVLQEVGGRRRPAGGGSCGREKAAGVGRRAEAGSASGGVGPLPGDEPAAPLQGATARGPDSEAGGASAAHPTSSAAAAGAPGGWARARADRGRGPLTSSALGEKRKMPGAGHPIAEDEAKGGKGDLVAVEGADVRKLVQERRPHGREDTAGEEAVAEGEEEGEADGEVWVGSADEVEEPATLAENAAAVGSATADVAGQMTRRFCCGSDAEHDMQKGSTRLLWFPSLSAALLASEFASFAYGVVRFQRAAHLEVALYALSGYVTRSREEVLKLLPQWIGLGMLLLDET